MPDKDWSRQGEALSEYVAARRQGTGATPPRDLERWLADVADQFAPAEPDRGSMDRVWTRISAGGMNSAPGQPVARPASPRWGRLTGTAAGVVLIVVSLSAGSLAAARLGGFGPLAPGASAVRDKTDLATSIDEAQGRVGFPLLALNGASPVEVRVICPNLPSVPCSPLATWVEVTYRLSSGALVTLAQGHIEYVGAVFQRVHGAFKGELTMGERVVRWIDCHDVPTGQCDTLPPGQVSAESFVNGLALVGWPGGNIDGSPFEYSLRSSELSVHQLLDLLRDVQ